MTSLKDITSSQQLYQQLTARIEGIYDFLNLCLSNEAYLNFMTLVIAIHGQMGGVGGVGVDLPLTKKIEHPRVRFWT